jgi:two-component system, chemotaxis family, protein-glutamate methylesterase/glutaminase
MTARIRVLVVEDSVTQAQALVRMLEADGDLEVVATAADAREAIERLTALRPDVVTMDLDIPAGGGQLAIDTIMAESPTPIVVITGLVGDAGAPIALEAISAGALDVIPKPRVWTAEDARDLRRRVRLARGVPVIARRRRRPGQAVGSPRRQPDAVVGIAASTGGPVAVAGMVAALRGLRAPLLVVQHIHPSFADGFGRWLQGAADREVTVAGQGMGIEDGHVYVAPGDRHLVVAPGRRLELRSEPPSLHRPSADVLFESLARELGTAGIAVVLTGMGNDGAAGAARLRAAGGHVLVQDQETSVVFGMPQAALRAGAADEAHALDALPGAVRAAVEAIV